jgi:glucose/arabinose dehydrogenase
VWASEHGALGGDELNRIVKGGNYGWPVATFSREYLGGFKI